MKHIIYLLTVICLSGSFYNLAPGISVSDIACGTLFVISIIQIMRKRWQVDQFSHYSMIYLPFMLLSAILSFEVANTIFLNYFRNYLWGLTVYFALANSIHNRDDLIICTRYLFIFLIIYLLNMQDLMQETFFEDLGTLDYKYGRNNVAFTALLFAIYFEFLYYSRLCRPYVFLGVILMLSIMEICASRFAILMAVISIVLYRISCKKRISKSEVLVYLSLIICAPIVFNFLLRFIDQSFFLESQNILADKLLGTKDDFWNSRIMEINVYPIIEFLNKKGPISIIFGEPTLVQHSFLSHSLITTGLVGCICFVYCQIKLLSWSYGYKKAGFFLYIVILVMILNDFIANARFIVCVNSVFYGCICALIYRYIVCYEDSNISM